MAGKAAAKETGPFLVDWSAYPSGAKARVTEPKLGIKAGGQITLNRLATEAFAAFTKVGCTFDPRDREVTIIGYNKVPKGVDADGNAYEDRHLRPLGTSKKVKQAYFAASGWLKAMGYDYATSGPQTFDCEIDGNAITFKLPKGALEPRPVVKRAVKAKAKAPATVPAEADEDDEQAA